MGCSPKIGGIFGEQVQQQSSARFHEAGLLGRMSARLGLQRRDERFLALDRKSCVRCEGVQAMAERLNDLVNLVGLDD